MTVVPIVKRYHRGLLALATASALIAIVSAVGILVDPRILTGVPIWLKPFKFGFSIAIYGFTLAWILSVMPRRSRVAEWAGTTIFVTMALELAVVVTQVVRGTTSHYNQTTPFNAALWQVMGTSIMIFSLAHLFIGVVALRQRIPDPVAVAAIRWGMGLSLLGMAAAVPMTLPSQAPGTPGISGAHSVGVADGAPGLPITGWSTTGGDLRIGHFVGLHALQALPLLAYLLGRFFGGRLDVRTRVRLVLVTGIAYGILVVLLTTQALRGQSLVRPDMVSGVEFVGLLAATVLAAGVVLGRGRRSQLVLAAASVGASA